MKLFCGEEEAEVRIEGETAVLDGRRVTFHASPQGASLDSLRIGQDDFRIRVARDGERVLVWCAGEVREFRRAASRRRSRPDSAGSLAAPMPGRIRKVLADPGKTVVKGDAVLVLEAMKMEHTIRAPRDGTVARILYREGDLVDAGALLAEIRQESVES